MDDVPKIRRLPSNASTDELSDWIDALSEQDNFEEAIAQWISTNADHVDQAILRRLYLELAQHFS